MFSKPVPRSERPWRQRLANSAHLRHLEDEAAHHPIIKEPILSMTQGRSKPPVVSASTPTSSIALRNYESKVSAIW